MSKFAVETFVFGGVRYRVRYLSVEPQEECE
jgi:hypothetical protein